MSIQRDEDDSFDPNKGAGEPDGTGSNYDVGYGKPPKHGQFQKGNKKGGRKKGSLGMQTMFDAAFGAKRTVKQNGKTEKVSKALLSITQLANQASAGNLRAISAAVPLIERYGPQDDLDRVTLKDIKPDIETLREYVAWSDQIHRSTDAEGCGFDEAEDGDADAPRKRQRRRG